MVVHYICCHILKKLEQKYHSSTIIVATSSKIKSKTQGLEISNGRVYLILIWFNSCFNKVSKLFESSLFINLIEFDYKYRKKKLTEVG